MNKHLKNQNGGAVLLTIVILSLLILILMSGATLKLAEVARTAERANEQLRYHNVMEDLAQALARAHVLARSGTCPSGTTIVSVGTADLCLPNGGVTGAAGIAGVCVDLDQNNATTHDQYCLDALQQVTQNDIDEERQRMVAERESFLYKTRSFLSKLLIPVADAACQWYGCTDVSGGTSGTLPEGTEEVKMDPSTLVVPATASTQQTGPPAVARNNMETWSPNVASYAYSNEILTPACTANIDMWYGCMRCSYRYERNVSDATLDKRVTCLRMLVCPPRNPGCANAQRIRQMIAIW